jgi:TPR repeat protein
MMVKRMFFLGCAILLMGMFSLQLHAQDSSKASVFREHRAPSLNLIRRSDETYELWEEFKLMEKANNGDASAQHELGIRYFLGRGFGVDTVKSAYWIQKAADQGLVMANYNLGIFLNNGWGLPWNPFKAFEHFQYAAKEGMPEAEYVYASILTDNLVTPQNWSEAYKWMKKAADAGFQPAKEALVEFEKRGIAVHADSSDTSSTAARFVATKDSALVVPTHSWKPVLLDFSNETATEKDELAFLKDMLHKGSPELKYALGISSLNLDKLVADSTLLVLIENAADVGSPEALAVLGRFYEKGIIVKKNLMTASIEYLRAIRLEFPRAPALLYNVVQDKKFVQQVHSLVLEGNAEAEFVCAGLISVGFDTELPPEESFKLLLKASAQHHVQAMIEIGLCYFSGRGVEKNREKGVEYWSKAAAMGSHEAQIRLTATNLISDLHLQDYAASIPELDSAAHKGSLLAQVALGYCYETGTGVPSSKPEAVRMYRESAYRGSQIAYYALKKMYDDLRPDSVQYKIKDE